MVEPHATACTRDKILHAARSLFAERGFKGTTTAAIAQHAGVNEALIFRHFPGKQDLYCAILRSKVEAKGFTDLLQAAESHSLPVEENIRLVGERLYSSYDSLFLRLYYQSALEGHELARKFYEKFVKILVQAIADLIQRGVEEGIFREVDPALAAQAFLGMFRNYILTAELFSDSDLQNVPPSRVVSTFCDIFLAGLRR